MEPFWSQSPAQTPLRWPTTVLVAGLRVKAVQCYLVPPILVVFFLGVAFKRLYAQGALWAMIVRFALGVLRMPGIVAIRCGIRILPAKDHRLRERRDLRACRVSLFQSIFDPPEVALAVPIDTKNLAHRYPHVSVVFKDSMISGW